MAAQRRVPQQARSIALVARVLDATAALVVEDGLDAVTTGRVAARADVAIGSVYRYFPDRQALLRALSARHLERYLDRVGAMIADAELARWQDAVDGVIDIFVAMHRTEPSFRALRFGDAVDEALLAGDRTNNDVLAEGFAALLVQRWGVRDTPDLAFRLEVVTELADALLIRSFATDPEGDPRFVDATREIARTYLERYVRDR